MMKTSSIQIPTGAVIQKMKQKMKKTKTILAHLCMYPFKCVFKYMYLQRVR